MKRTRDLDQFKHVLPYASEIFGVYQPLIGWRSKRIWKRFMDGFRQDKKAVLSKMLASIAPAAELELELDPAGRTVSGAGAAVRVRSLSTGTIERAPSEHNSFLLDALAKRLPAEEPAGDDWDAPIDEAQLDQILNTEVKERILELQKNAGLRNAIADSGADPVTAVVRQITRESAVARYLLELKRAGETETLKQILYGKSKKWLAQVAKLAFQDSLDLLDPHHDLGRVTLSPISIVHLFRQYFFEFDTFLGPPVSHVWLSPGSSVELVEIQTRRTLTEKTFESEITTTQKTETELTEQEEISTAVKEDNKSTTQFGFNTSVHQGWIGGSADASASINLENTQQKARETAHKHMRQQTDKVSSEIRKNYKTTFKTVSEVTDTSSKRYVLNNTTDRLINYELRRKMRQVGVQVQDIGTYLCWQTFVDDPGRQLGVSELVHIAKPPETGNIPPPESTPPPEAYSMKTTHSIPFKPKTEDTDESDMDESYRNGKEVNTDDNEGDEERIDPSHRFSVTCDKTNYEFDPDVSVTINVGGNDMEAKIRDVEGNGREVSFTVYLKHVNFHNQPSLMVEVTTHWRPTDDYAAEIEAQNLKNVEKYNAETQREFERAFVDAARERIELASGVRPRKFEHLREEERIVVYRMLIQDMLTKDLPLKDDRTRHAVAELLNSIFDIDKMLYFVAPEWWRPRLHRSHQDLGAATAAASGSSDGSSGGTTGGASVNMGLAKTSSVYAMQKQLSAKLTDKAKLVPLSNRPTLAPQHRVGWGGEHREDNYYITEDSEPARLGSSLGWLLQLDGDDQRNAFLNAPWVKAVIPIRPGKEKAAFNWLKRVNVEGADGLDASYSAPAAELAEIPHSGSKVTIEDAINHLCSIVAAKHESSMKVAKYPVDEINDDNKVSATPIDKVYEHGFYPNKDGFKLLMGDDFEVFDQWVEILPTDQVVPVEVEYDPITGRQVQIVEPE